MDLESPGALLFSPPINIGGATTEVVKRHLCDECYSEILALLATPRWSKRKR
jgi:hypothetical protein